MFIGARIAYYYGDVAKAGVLLALEGDNVHIKYDSGVIDEVPLARTQLINNWGTYSKPKAVGMFKTFPADTSPSTIFLSKKPVLFNAGGMRSVWYWVNHVVFNGKMKEPNLVASTHSRNWGLWNSKTRVLNVSNRCHSVVEFATIVAHEQIHQYNTEIERSNYRMEGSHGASFLHWIPIIREKIGLSVTTLAEPIEVEHDAESAKEENKVKDFVFVVFQLGRNWCGLVIDHLDNLPLIVGTVNSLLKSSRRDADNKVYAGVSNLQRVMKELKLSKNGTLPRNLLASFRPELVKLLEDTCKPISGYRSPKLIPEDD